MRGKILKLLVIPLLLACTSQAVLSCACDTKKIDPKPTTEHHGLIDLRIKAALYRNLQIDLRDEKGWYPGCDGLLFNSLDAFAGGPQNIFSAEEESGGWRRQWDFSICRPNANPESETCISRDGFRGLFVYLMQQNDVQALKRIRDYGRDHNWFMGCARNPGVAFSRTWFNPSIRNQLDRMIDRSVPKLFPTEKNEMIADDYEAHLAVLSIYTEFQIHGKITANELSTLKKYAEKSPKNALFQALYHKFSDGDQSLAIDILLDATLFPVDRLPTDKDHFADYLWQRDPGPDWQPCDTSENAQQRRCEGRTHPATDYFFALAVIEN